MIKGKAYLQQVEIICREVGEFILEEGNKVSTNQIEHKSLNSLVSYVDKGAEERLVESLHQLLPEAGFIAEEGTSNKEGEKYHWIIDPLDGTTNYLHGIPTFAISVALKADDQIVLGVVYELGQKEMFSAERGKGAFLNGKKIQVSAADKMKDALFATGFPYYDFGRMEEFNQLLNYFFKNTRGVRRLGSAATDLAYVACGRFSGFFEYGLSPWDVAAGALLVEEAGGKVSDFSSGQDWLFGQEILAGSSNLFPALRELVKKYMQA